jgi:hypothetical protein
MKYQLRLLIKPLVISIAFVFIWQLTLGRDYSLVGYSNGFFIVGLVMFFWGLITLTRAGNIFISTNYVFKMVFKRELRTKNYYEYMTEREVKTDNESATRTLVVGVAYLIIAYALGNLF